MPLDDPGGGDGSSGPEDLPVLQTEARGHQAVQRALPLVWTSSEHGQSGPAHAGVDAASSSACWSDASRACRNTAETLACAGPRRHAPRDAESGRLDLPVVSVLDVDSLCVSYGPVQAVRGVSFSVAEGEIVGLLGANGAGKTSTLEVCEGYRPASSGTVRVLGLEPTDQALRQEVGVVLQDIGVTPFLSVREVLTRNAAYYDQPRPVAEVIDLVGLGEKADVRVQTLSGGQQRRLDLALGILGSPRLLFLDEPTTGFDPGARRGAWQLVRDLRDQGTTIVLTTHYLEEAEALADRVVVIAAGEVVAEGAPAELGGRSDGPTVVRFRVDPGAVLPALPTSDQIVREGDHVRVACADVVETLWRLTGWAREEGGVLDGLSVQRATLEDVYLQLTGAPR